MRICDVEGCGEELKTFGTLAFSPERGPLEKLDLCDKHGHILMGLLKALSLMPPGPRGNLLAKYAQASDQSWRIQMDTAKWRVVVAWVGEQVFEVEASNPNDAELRAVKMVAFERIRLTPRTSITQLTPYVRTEPRLAAVIRTAN